jgi:hypothetical protein
VVGEAKSGKEAVSVIERNKPDLALLHCGWDRNQGMARILSGGGN